MSLKSLFGLEETELTDIDIMRRISSSYEKGLHEIEFVRHDGAKIVIHFPHIDFSRHIDPWDGFVGGKAA